MKPSEMKVDPVVIANANRIFSEKKIALFIVTYNGEKHIKNTLSRIPSWCRPLFSEIYVIDDSSKDNTNRVTLKAGKKLGLKNFSVMRTPNNQGYGGNQKIGYTYAIEKQYDIVILLHGDGQYPPEYIPHIIAGYKNPKVDAVFGSRMIIRSNALRGGMPLYKWLGNQVLTSLENTILGTHLSEFHSGYRSYRVDALKRIPFHLNSDDFHFDTDIIIQLILQENIIAEIPIPTHYGDETCHVNGMKYAWNCLESAIKSRLHQKGILFQPNFEMPEINTRNYQLKLAPTSLHTFVLGQKWKHEERVIDLGANDGLLSQKISKKGALVTAVDTNIPMTVPGIQAIRADLNENFSTTIPQKNFDTVIALDIIEHLYSPEKTVLQINQLLKKDGLLYASTANIAYIIMRLTLLMGWFNYGKKGILDQTHHRLFTVNSFKQLLQNASFDIIAIKGFGPPIIDAFGDTLFWRFIDKVCSILAKTFPRLFAFNFLIIARKKISVLEKTTATISSLRSID